MLDQIIDEESFQKTQTLNSQSIHDGKEILPSSVTFSQRAPSKWQAVLVPGKFFVVRKLRDKFVTGPVHGSKMNRVCELRLKFVAQFQDKIVDGPGARIIVKTPHLI